MSFTKTLAAIATAALMATGAFAQNIAVVAGSIEDGFFNLIKKGVDDATLMVEANGGTVNYLRVPNFDNFGPDLVTLINQAAPQGVDGIAIPVWGPEAQVPAFLAARAQGIVIMQYNAGQGVKEDLAAVNLETRCEGVIAGAEEAGAKVTVLRVPANLDGAVTGPAEAIKAELIGDQSIDAVMKLAARASDASANAVSRIGGSQIMSPFDLNPAVSARCWVSPLAPPRWPSFSRASTSRRSTATCRT